MHKEENILQSNGTTVVECKDWNLVHMTEWATVMRSGVNLSLTADNTEAARKASSLNQS